MILEIGVCVCVCVGVCLSVFACRLVMISHHRPMLSLLNGIHIWSSFL